LVINLTRCTRNDYRLISISTRFHFLFHVAASSAIYTLSLHDALPISPGNVAFRTDRIGEPGEKVIAYIDHIGRVEGVVTRRLQEDRKSTRLNSSHVKISYAVFCLKKKKIYHIKEFSQRIQELQSKGQV